jgi:hypothetical protein
MEVKTIKHIGKLKTVLAQNGDKVAIFCWKDKRKMDLENAEYISLLQFLKI